MADHPYKNLPTDAFWSKSVSENFDATRLLQNQDKFLFKSDKVVSAGSCFASNLVPYIESAGLTYVRTEKHPETLEKLGENLGYANFSARYGNIYTARQLLQLITRALGKFKPEESYWQENGNFIDPFRPGLRFPASSLDEFHYLTNSHLSAVLRAFESADVFVFTLGLTEAWISKKDGAVYPACPGTIAGNFDSNLYQFKNFTAAETFSDLQNFAQELREINQNVRIVLSVSPVPLVATATKNHVLTATTYSKSVLRVAAEDARSTIKDVFYFPAYEIITGPQAPDIFFESDKRNVSKIGIETVMQALLGSNELNGNSDNQIKSNSKESNAISTVTQRLVEAECDEIMVDPKFN